jgi:CubicO group peptidase (beta-lactamase class C family)
MINTKTTAVLILTLSLAAPSASRGDQQKGAQRAEATPFPAAKPQEVGIDPAALEKLREGADEGDSDTVVVIKDGRLVADWDFGRERGPIEAMSATKSVVNLAVGLLIDRGRIKSLGQPVHEFYPETVVGYKAEGYLGQYQRREEEAHCQRHHRGPRRYDCQQSRHADGNRFNRDGSQTEHRTYQPSLRVVT